MAADKICCVPSCAKPRSGDLTLHVFPNPDNDADRFRTWLHNIGGEISTLEKRKIFKYRKVCDRHFEQIYHTRNKRISANAVPTLHMSAGSADDVLINHDSHADSQLADDKFNTEPARSADDALINHDSHADSQVAVDHFNTEPDLPSEPLQFSWQGDNHISLDDHPENEKLFKAESETIRDEKNATVLIEENEKLFKAESETIRDEKNATVLIEDNTTIDFGTKVTDYCCDACREYIAGYTCVQCDDYDLCSACETTLMHPQHYMLRVPRNRPQREVNLIIEVVRRKLKILEAELRNDGITCMDWNNVEIKKEEDPFEEVAIDSITGSSRYCEIPVLNPLTEAEIGNTGDAPDSESEKHVTFESLHDNKSKKTANKGEYNSEKDWPDEALLDIDYVDNDCDGNKKPTLQGLVDDLDLGLEEIVRSDGSRVKHDESESIEHQEIPLTCANVPEKISHLKSTKQLKGSSDVNVINTKNIDVTTKVPNTLNSKTKKITHIGTQVRVRVLTPDNSEITVPKGNVHLNVDFLDDLKQSPGLSKVPSFSKKLTDNKVYPAKRKTTVCLGSSELSKLTDNTCHPAKRKTTVCLDSPELSKLTANIEASVPPAKRKPIVCLDSPELSKLTANKEVPVPPAKRKPIVCLDSPELFKLTANKEVPVPPTKRKPIVCLDSPELSKLTANKEVSVPPAKRKPIVCLDSPELSKLTANKEVPVPPAKRKPIVCLDSPELSKLTANKEVSVPPAKRKPIICLDSPELFKLTANKEVPVPPTKRKPIVCLDSPELSKLTANKEVSVPPAKRKPIVCLDSPELSKLTANKEVPVPPAKRKPIVCLDSPEFFKLPANRKYSRPTKRKTFACLNSLELSKCTKKDVSEFLAKRKTVVCSDSPELSKLVAQQPCSDEEILIHPAKRKSNVCSDEDLLLDDERQAPGLSKVLTTSETARKTTELNTSNSAISEQLKVPDIDT